MPMRIHTEEREERRLIMFLYLGTMSLMLLLTYVTYVNMDGYVRTMREVRFHNTLLLELDDVMSALQAQESGARGYLLTHDPTYLEPYKAALERRPREEETVRDLVRGTLFETEVDSFFRQTARATDMHRLLVLNSDRSRGMRRAESERLQLGKGTMDHAHAQHRRIVDGILRERRQRLDEVRHEGVGSPVLIGGYSFLAILATSLLFWRLSKALRRTERVKDDLRNMVLDLDSEVRTRRAVQELLQQVLDASPAGIMSFRSVRDGTGRIVDFEWLSANRSACRMMGRDDLVGGRLLKEMPEHRAMGLFDAYVSVVETGKEIRREVHHQGAGMDHWYINHGVKLDDGFLVVFSDITEQRQLQQMSSETERFELIGQITRTVAHEVRNPLTNIHLALEQLEEELDGRTTDAAPLLDIMDRNLKRIGGLVKDMLESTRKREIILRPCRVEDLVQAALETVADRLALQEMRAVVRVDTGGLRVQADSELMVLAITNILVNAVEAMEPGKGELLLCSRTAGGAVLIEITDNGRGMPAETRDRLFEPFFSARRGGLGLGLTTARSILNAHGVRLSVDSEEGRGTTFTLRFPVLS